MLQTKELIYQDAETPCRGFIAYDDTHKQPKPCVLIAHDWSGRNEFVCKKAEQLASMGYVGFAIDMYGNARIGKTNEEKSALIAPLVANRPALARRIMAAFTTALTLPEVNPTHIAAMGYCFGGLCVLDLARTGSNVNGVVSFHGLLTAPDITICKQIRASILVLHGYDDPLAPPTQVHRFAQEMTERKADWQLHMYGNTKHSFTNPLANDAANGLVYNAKADRRSWNNAELFFKELFA